MNNIAMKATVKTIKKGLEITVEREARLDARDLSFEIIGTFMEEVGKINALLKSAIKKNQFTEFEICNYDWEPNGGMKAYDRWEYRGYAGDDACEMDNGSLCYYLQPDTRYTAEYHDMVYEYTLKSLTDHSALCRRRA